MTQGVAHSHVACYTTSIDIDAHIEKALRALWEAHELENEHMPIKSVARTAQLVKPLVELLRLQFEIQGGSKPAEIKGTLMLTVEEARRAGLQLVSNK